MVAAGVVAKKILSAGNNEFSCNATILEVGGEKDIEAGLQKAIDAKDSIGGIVECRVDGLPIGIGEPFFDSVESAISHAVFAIPAIKGVEFGAGFAAADAAGRARFAAGLHAGRAERADRPDPRLRGAHRLCGGRIRR